MEGGGREGGKEEKKEALRAIQIHTKIAVD